MSKMEAGVTSGMKATGREAATSHVRSFDLPHGARVTFRFTGTGPEGLGIKWRAPGPPDHRTPRALRKFLAAYRAARDEFLADLATMRGGSIVIVDAPLGDEPPRFRRIFPERRQ